MAHSQQNVLPFPRSRAKRLRYLCLHPSSAGVDTLFATEKHLAESFFHSSSVATANQENSRLDVESSEYQGHMSFDWSRHSLTGQNWAGPGKGILVAQSVVPSESSGKLPLNATASAVMGMSNLVFGTAFVVAVSEKGPVFRDVPDEFISRVQMLQTRYS